MSITVQIYSIEKKLYEGEADSLQLPGTDGELGVMPLHTPLISSLKHGIIKLRRRSDVEEIPIGGGFVEMGPGSQVIVLAN